MRIGFSGTSAGMTNDQMLQVHMLLGDMWTGGATQASHGMCQGADEQFHGMAKVLGYFLIGCPGVSHKDTLWKRSEKCQCDMVMPVKFFLDRNRDIVRESDILIATPKETKEQMRGSGTWATIRYARQAHRPLIIVWPDGTSTVEHLPGVSTAEDYRMQCLRGEWV